MLRPKSAQETLIDCTRLMDDILGNHTVQDQMSELKVRIGDDGLPLNIQANVSQLPLYGVALISQCLR